MIARDEARRLPRSLGSVADWAGEIVVVTNDCVDDTAAVARSFGAKVSEHPFQNFRDQKAYALALATQPWVLSLDADEVVTPELRAEIRTFITGAPDAVGGAWLPRRLWFMGRWIRHGDNYPDLVLRLVRRERAHMGEAVIHEQLRVDGRTARLRSDLLHYSNDSVARHVGKINFFCDAFLAEAEARGKTTGPLAVTARSGWRFFRAYFLRLGLLDGFPGLYLAYLAAVSTFLKHARLYERQQQRRQGRPEGGRP